MNTPDASLEAFRPSEAGMNAPTLRDPPTKTGV